MPICAVSAVMVTLTEAYLIGDVVPVVFAAQVLEVLLQQRSHFNDALRHVFDLA